MIRAAAKKPTYEIVRRRRSGIAAIVGDSFSFTGVV
jgi:hypothetical protein